MEANLTITLTWFGRLRALFTGKVIVSAAALELMHGMMHEALEEFDV